MLNYIKAELYRNFNRLYYWSFVIIISGLGLSLNILMKATSVNANMDLSELMYIGIKSINLPLFLVLMMIDIVTSEENKNLTLKNAVSFGIPRNRIVLSKIIATVVLSIIAAFIILTVFLGSGAMLFGLGKDFSIDIVKDFSLRLLVALPLWIGGISVGTFLGIVFKNNTMSSFVYFGVFSMTGNIISLLSLIVYPKLMNINKFLITTNLSNIKADTVASNTLGFAALVGIGFTVVFTILSMLYFNKKEIK